MCQLASYVAILWKKTKQTHWRFAEELDSTVIVVLNTLIYHLMLQNVCMIRIILHLLSSLMVWIAWIAWVYLLLHGWRSIRSGNEEEPDIRTGSPHWTLNFWSWKLWPIRWNFSVIHVMTKKRDWRWGADVWETFMQNFCLLDSFEFIFNNSIILSAPKSLHPSLL